MQLLPGRRNISQTEALCCGKQGIARGLRSVFVRCFVLRMPEAMPEVGWDDQKIMEKISHFLSEIFFLPGTLDKKVLFAIIDL